MRRINGGQMSSDDWSWKKEPSQKELNSFHRSLKAWRDLSWEEKIEIRENSNQSDTEHCKACIRIYRRKIEERDRDE